MPRTIIQQRSQAARERIAAVGEPPDGLPRAICSACGGVVNEGEGVAEDPSPWAADPWALADVERRRDGLPLIANWRRTHARCSSPDRIVRQIIGGDRLAPDVAGAALDAARVALGTSLVVHGLHESRLGMLLRRREPRPWAHLTDADRDALRQAVKEARARVEPRRCVDGACAWCGVSRSLGWLSSPETWSDGSPAPLCRDCARVWALRGNPAERDALRACALEALSGANGWGSDGLGIRVYAEIARDDHSGTAEPWTFAPEPLATLRENARESWPNSLPATLRDEYVARAREASRRVWEQARADEAAAAADAAEREAEEAREAGWPI